MHEFPLTYRSVHCFVYRCYLDAKLGSDLSDLDQLDPQSRGHMREFSLYNGYTRQKTYRLHPPSDVAVITDWRILVRLMALLTPYTKQKCAKIKVSFGKKYIL